MRSRPQRQVVVIGRCLRCTWILGKMCPALPSGPVALREDDTGTGIGGHRRIGLPREISKLVPSFWGRRGEERPERLTTHCGRTGLVMR